MVNSQEAALKIAFVGTSCVGKTSLLNYYEGRFQGDDRIAHVAEAARVHFLANATLPEGQRFTAVTQGKIQQLTLQTEKAAYSPGVEVIICDRSVLDAVAYVRGNGDREGSQALLEGVRSWLPTYRRIFLLDPKDVPYERDEVRRETSGVRERNHQAFLEILMESGVEYELLSGDMPERIRRVNKVLQI